MVNNMQQLLELPVVEDLDRLDVGFFSIQQLIEIEGLEDDMLLYQMGINCESESDSEDHAAQVHGSSSMDVDAQQIQQQQHEQQQQQNSEGNANTPREMCLDKRRQIVDELFTLEVEGKLPWGAKRKVSNKFNIHRTTLDRLWKDVEAQRAMGSVIDVRSKKIGNCGRKPLEYSEEWLQSVPLHLRTTIRSFAGALKVPPSTVYRLLKKGKLRSHTSSNHPTVTPNHKIERMKWVLNHILPATRDQPPTFVDMENVIHIDEKWFYLNPDMRRFYLLPKEDDPYRCCQHKRFKIKAMFMAATSRPIFDSEGKMIHDGKFGIFPFIKRVAAKKKSKNRPRGTIETKAVESVTQEVVRDMLIKEVIPCIMRTWPEGVSKDIILQQDNARPHIAANDPAFVAAATQNGFNIQLKCQPAQSPDLNVLDLGFFRAIQALQYQSFPKNLDDLITKVQDSYDFFDPEVLKYSWLQLQYVMVEILKVQGGNNYKNPHHGKRRLERLGLLPKNVTVDQQVIDEAVKYLNDRFIQVCEPEENFETDCM